MSKKVFVPIYEKEDNKFFVIHPDFIGDNEDDAMKIGWGSMWVECVLMEMEFTNKVKEIDPDNTPHIKANLGNCQVAIFEGPLFQETVSA